MLRNDLTEDVVTPEITKLAESTTISGMDHLRACMRLAMLGQPMPWEKQTRRQRLISTLRETMDIDNSLASDDEILKITTRTFLRQALRYSPLAIDNFKKSVRK